MIRLSYLFFKKNQYLSLVTQLFINKVKQNNQVKSSGKKTVEYRKDFD